MKSNYKKILNLFLALLLCVCFTSCNKSNTSRNKNQSSATGWAINSKKGGFKYNTSFKGQEAPPNMVLVEGGTYTKGRVQDDPMRDWNNTPNQQHVMSFYMDETEVTNIMYLEYLDWLKRTYGNSENKDLRNLYNQALPDTLVWRNKLGYSEDMVNNYLRHPAFADYPVVGVKWIQATNFSNWRSYRYQELILEKAGFLAKGTTSADSELWVDKETGQRKIIEQAFNTDAYVIVPNKTYDGQVEFLRGNKSKIETVENADGSIDTLPPSSASRETGLISPKFRLPTESEWEYAALGLKEVRDFNVYRGRKKYPWQGQYTRTGQRKNLGDQLANFKNSDGDYGGIAGWSDDGADITNNVKSYPANGFGLYDMAGNVAEWVADVYRPIVDDEFNDFNYFRGNDYKKFSIGSDGKAKVVGPDEIEYKTLSNGKRVATRLPGEIALEDLDENDTRYRTQFDKSYNVNFRDGDFLSSRNYNPENRKLERSSGADGETRMMYKSPSYADADPNKEGFQYDPSEDKTTLINDQARVYKGGSWKDRAYWLDPAQRRFYPQDQATDFIGFRNAMSRVGAKTFSKKKSRN